MALQQQAVATIYLMLFLAFCVFLLSESSNVHMRSFQEGDEIQLKVNKLTSVVSDLVDFDYYRYPFCQPERGPRLDNQNLGQFLAGDRIANSPYRLLMKRDMYCEQLCLTVGRFDSIIRKGYHNNWLVDYLPSASKLENSTQVTTKVWGGFPVGFVDNKKAYIYNHVNIELYYHKVVEGHGVYSAPLYQIVRFVVEPFSIKHDWDDQGRFNNQGGKYLMPKAKINNPIDSCNPIIPYDMRSHTSFEMLATRESQPSSETLLFTYDVRWVEDPTTTGASRWDIYLTSNGLFPDGSVWSRISPSIMLVLVVGAFVAYLIRHFRRRHLDGYTTGEEGAATTSIQAPQRSSANKWVELCCVQVFSPPVYRPRLLAVACGTGAQLLLTTLASLVLCFVGILSPAWHGSMRMCPLLLFCFCGGANGYVTARFSMTFGGNKDPVAAGMAAVFFPRIVFGAVLFVIPVYWATGSTYCLHLETLFTLMLLWGFVHVPLVFLGAHKGYQAGSLLGHGETAAPPTHRPSSPPCEKWFLSLPFCVIAGGAIPIYSLKAQLFYVFSSSWMGSYFGNVYGCLLVSFLLMGLCPQ